jgi:hypothetical protein
MMSGEVLLALSSPSAGSRRNTANQRWDCRRERPERLRSTWTWKTGSRAVGRLRTAVSGRLGQMAVPISEDASEIS